MKRKPKRGACSVCKKDCAVTKAGGIRVHYLWEIRKVIGSYQTFTWKCLGSGFKAKR